MDTLERYPAVTHYVFAVSSLVIGLVHFRTHDHGSRISAAEVAVPLILAGGICYAGYRFSKLGPSRSQVFRTGAILSAGYLYGAGFVAFIEIIQLLGGVQPIESRYMIMIGGFGGTAMATVITHFYVAYTQRLQELRKQTERAKRLQKQVSVLNRTLRHNIRNELTIIEGWLDEAVASDDRSAEEAKEKAESHLAELEELSETARQIHSVLGDEAVTKVDITDRIDERIDSLQEHVPAVDVTTDEPESATVEAHPDLDRCIEEALLNAVEHNDPQELEIRVSVEETSRERDGDEWYRVDVTDTGGGIPPIEVEALEKLEETKLEHGVGLGLYLIKTIVEQSGGDVEITPSEAGGTTIRMWFPKPAESGAGTATAMETETA